VRRYWLATTAWVGDHPMLAGLLIVVLVASTLFYCIRLHGFTHIGESLSRWRMEVFGGRFDVERSIEVPDVILSFRDEEFDQVDAVSGSAGFMGGTAFRKEIEEIAKRKGARIRGVALDPRMGMRAHPANREFEAEAEAFGLRPWEYLARCRHSAAVLIHLMEDFGPVLEVRLLDKPISSATAPFFVPGRSVQLYRAADPSIRLDILVPQPGEADGMDSFTHPGLIIRHRPEDEDVKRFKAAFEEAWRAAKPLDAAARAEILKSLSPDP
jgi:hypothetical protein